MSVSAVGLSPFSLQCEYGVWLDTVPLYSTALAVCLYVSV